jgi:tellurite resistance protein
VPLSPEQEWTLTACGLVAHADGILEAGEWDQVLWMLDERLGAAEATEWVGWLSDEATLRARMKGMSPPAPLFTETILDKAWRMALADGEASEAERTVHDEIAGILGATPPELDAWRTQWLTRAQRRSEIVAGFAAVLAASDGVTEPMERTRYAELLDRLPLGPGRREAMETQLDAPPDIEALIGQTLGLDPEDRGLALMAIVPMVRAAGTGTVERALYLDLAERVAIDPDQAERWLER